MQSLRKPISRLLPFKPCLSSVATAQGHYTSDSIWVKRTGLAVFWGLAGFGVYLGNWQMTRKHDKVQLMESRRAGLESSPIELPTTPSREEMAQLLHKRVKCTGKFDASHQVFVGLRKSPQPPLEKYGQFVYTPLRCDDGQTVIVNRGWIPKDKFKLAAAPEGVVEIEGIVNKTEKSPYVGIDKTSLVWPYMDVTCVAERLGLDYEPVLVDALEISGRGKWPMPKTTDNFMNFYILPATHQGYAITWYGLGIVAGVLGTLRFTSVGNRIMAAASRNRARSHPNRTDIQEPTK